MIRRSVDEIRMKITMLEARKKIVHPASIDAHLNG